MSVDPGRVREADHEADAFQAIARTAEPEMVLTPEELGAGTLPTEDPALAARRLHPVKRAVDVVGSLLLLLLLGLPMLLIALAIRLDSRGPALFRQPRAGLGGRGFVCWKFRTMRSTADEEREDLRDEHGSNGALFKLAADPRVTRVGRPLRRYSVDELPQLVNVLRGEMSLVGPRPHPLDDVARYDVAARRRLTATPGMTGLWQVSGRSSLGWDEALDLDLRYIDDWSIGLDLTIVARTVGAVLRPNGSF